MNPNIYFTFAMCLLFSCRGTTDKDGASSALESKTSSSEIQFRDPQWIEDSTFFAGIKDYKVTLVENTLGDETKITLEFESILDIINEEIRISEQGQAPLEGMEQRIEDDKREMRGGRISLTLKGPDKDHVAAQYYALNIIQPPDQSVYSYQFPSISEGWKSGDKMYNIAICKLRKSIRPPFIVEIQNLYLKKGCRFKVEPLL